MSEFSDIFPSLHADIMAAEQLRAPRMSIHQFHAKDDHHRPGTAWRHIIEAASSEHEVIARLRDFFASFTPYEIDALPADLRPRKLVDGAEIASYALDLMRAQSLGHTADPLAAFAEVVGQAAARVSSLLVAPLTARESA
jgi:hypothetical protein